MPKLMTKTFTFLMLMTLAASVPTNGRAEDKKIVMIAGRPSHPPGQHEHNAGVLLFKKCLDGVPGIKVETHSGGWPKDSAVFDGAAAVVIYSDGGRGHPALQEQNLQQLETLMAKGAGLALVHYGVEPTKDKGQKEFLDWIGGCFEINWSVNPHWAGDFTKFPDHPITRGVKPFKIVDEWYYHMRFTEGMKGVTPILTALPTAETLTRPDGTHSGNPDVRKAVTAGEPQHVAWAYENSHGMLNGILWVAKAEVPKNGVESTVTEDDLKQNLDQKGQRPRPTPPPAAPVAR
jgi:hypothetical protein